MNMIINNNNNNNNNIDLESVLKLYFKKRKIKIGTLIKAKIIEINKNYVYIDAGLKSEGIISRNEFIDKDGNLSVLNIGNIVNVILTEIDNGYGQTIFSREKAREYETLFELKNAYINKENILGLITQQIKGGFIVLIDNIINAFLPGSLVSYIVNNEENSNLVGQTLELKIVNFNPEIDNIILSRKPILEKTYFNEQNEKLLNNNITVGMILNGIVKNITEYGAFIDLGTVDGLLHITDVSWSKLKNPLELITLGQKLKIKVINIDEKINKISLGLKQLTPDPWEDIEKKYFIGKSYNGKLINNTDLGYFVELKKDIEGLIYMNELIHLKKLKTLKNYLNSYIRVIILHIDIQKRRIALTLKQNVNYFLHLLNTYYKINDLIVGTIINITDFAIYLDFYSSINLNIKGLIHIKDISWNINIFNVNIHFLKKKYHIGDKIFSYVKEINYIRERLMLSLLPFLIDPFLLFLNKIENILVVKLKDQFLEFNINNKYKINNILLDLPFRIKGILKNIKNKKKYYNKYYNKYIKVKIVNINILKRKIICKLISL